MRKLKLGRSTRSIYLGLACLSIALHLLLAFFCLSVLQTACVLPSSSSIPRKDSPHHEYISHSSNSSSVSSSHPSGPTIPQEDPKEKLIGTFQKVKSNSKLEALFKHPLYNLPHPELQEDDWLLRVKPDEKAKDSGSEKEREDTISIDSEW